MSNDNEEIRLGNETDVIVKRFINSFLNNYEEGEIILRSKSNLKVLIYCLIIFIKQV